MANSDSNMSTAYLGTFARTKEEAKQKTVELKKSLKLSVQWHLVTKLSVEGGPTNVDMIL